MCHDTRRHADARAPATLVALTVVAAALLAGCDDGPTRPGAAATVSAADASQAAWSPDGKQIAFTSTRTGTRQIYLVDLDGTHLVELTHDGENASPAWSPDGRRLAFARRSPGEAESGGAAIFTIGADGTGLVRVAGGPAGAASPSWSPDGQRVVFSGVPAAGAPPVLLVAEVNGTGDVTALAPDLVGATTPAWSPDGAWIAFAVVHAGEMQRAGDTQLYVMHADGSGIAALTERTSWNNDRSPAWSPDGRRIVFESDRGGGADLLWRDLYVVDRDGSHMVPLTQATLRNRLEPAWSPDGTRIAFTSFGAAAGDHTALYVMHADGTQVVALTEQ